MNRNKQEKSLHIANMAIIVMLAVTVLTLGASAWQTWRYNGLCAQIRADAKKLLKARKMLAETKPPFQRNWTAFIFNEGRSYD